MNEGGKKRVLFICTHNAGRSQIAEAWLRHLFGDRYEAYSGGVEPGQLNPYVVKSMKELGLDLWGHRSKHIDEFQGREFDQVVTVCDNAADTCPFFPGGKEYLHQSFPDPAGFTGSKEEVLGQVGQVRDEIMEWIQETFGPEDSQQDGNYQDT